MKKENTNLLIVFGSSWIELSVTRLGEITPFGLLFWWIIVAQKVAKFYWLYQPGVSIGILMFGQMEVDHPLVHFQN